MHTFDLAEAPEWLATVADFHLGALMMISLSLVAGLALRQPAKRLAVAWATTAGLVLLAALAALPGWSIWNLTAAPEAPVVTQAIDRPEPASMPIEPRFASPPARSAQPPAETFAAPLVTATVVEPPPLPAAEDPIDWRRVATLSAAVVFGVGTIAAAGWLLLGWTAGTQLVFHARPAPKSCQELLEGLCGASPSPRLLVSDRLDTPVAIGLRHPSILLPATTAERTSDHELRAVLAHELAHIRNADLWLLAGLRLLLVLLWMNPLYWLLRRRVRLDQEALADAAAAEQTTREAYAEQLVGWARTLAGRRPTPRLAGAAGLWEGPSQLRRRVGVLLDERFTVLRQATRRWRAACGLACLSLAVLASLVTLSPAEPSITIATPEEATAVKELPVRVVDESGAAVAGAKVIPWALRSSQGHGDWRANEDDPSAVSPKEVVTDAAGEAVVLYPHYRDADEQVRTLAVSLFVDHPDYAFVNRLHIDVPIETEPREIELQSGATVELEVTLDGEPADTADLQVMSSDGRAWRGEYEPSREPGKLILPVMSPGPAAVRLIQLVDGEATHFSPRIELDLTAGETEVRRVALEPAKTIRGRLGDEAPRPIVDGRVKAWGLKPSRDAAEAHWFSWAPVSEDGTFTIDSWPADEPIQLIALCRGYKATNGDPPPEESRVREKDPFERPHVFRPNQFDEQLLLPMTPLVRCDVQTVDLDGQPITGVKVVACPNVQWWNDGSQIYCDPLARADRLLANRDYYEIVDRNHAPEFWQEVDDQGRATLYLPEGREDLVVISEEYELPVYLGSRDVEVTLKIGEPVSKTLVLQPRGTEQLGDWDKLAGVVFGCSTREGRRICALPGVKQKVQEFRDRLAEADDPRDPKILSEAYELISETFAEAGDDQEAAKWRRKAVAEQKKAADKAKAAASQAKQTLAEEQADAAKAAALARTTATQAIAEAIESAKRAETESKASVEKARAAAEQAERTVKRSKQAIDESAGVAAVGGLIEGVYTRTSGKMRWRVLGPDGEPMAGASVRSNLGGKEGIVNATQTTDERGEVVIELPELLDLARIWTRKADHPPLFTQWWPRQEPDGYPLPDEFTVRMVHGQTAGGTVVDEAGRPIVGVAVAVRRASGGEPVSVGGRPALGTWLAYGSAAVETDEAGRWSITNVPPGDDVELSLMLSHPAYVNDGAWGESQRAQKVTSESLLAGTARVVMRRGAELTGRVIDPSGQPVEGAIVIWGDDPYFDQGENEVLTDANGVYRLPLLSEEERRISVVAEGWAPRSEMINFAVIDGPTNFKLQRGGEIRLRVQDGTGKPIPEAWAYLPDNAWRGTSVLHHQSGNSTVTQPIPRRAGDDGVYTWDWAPADSVTFRVGRKGYATRRVVVSAGEEQVVTLGPERVARGTIVDASTGEPVRGCTVLTTVQLSTEVVERFDPIKCDGEFELRLDRDDAAQGVRFEALGYRVKKLGPWELDERIPELRVELEPAEPLSGRVAGLDGTPLSGARVRMATPTVSLYDLRGDYDDMSAYSAIADDDGRFVFARPYEPYALVVSTDGGFAWAEHNADEQPATLAIRPWARVAGQILKQGQLVEGQAVHLSVNLPEDSVIRHRHLGTATTDRVGAFVFDRVVAGSVIAQAQVGPWQESPLTSGPSEPVSVGAGETARLVWGAESGAVSGVVSLRGTAGDVLDLSKSLNYLIPKTAAESGIAEGWRSLPHHAVKLSPDGEFRITGVAPGEYVLRLKLYAPPENGCLVDAIGERDIAVTVAKAPVELGRVVVDVSTNSTAADGAEPAATQFVSTQPSRDDTAEPGNRDIGPTASNPGRLIVECIDADGAPVAGVEVRVVANWVVRPGLVDGELAGEGMTDASGRCVFDALPIEASPKPGSKRPDGIEAVWFSCSVQKEGYASCGTQRPEPSASELRQGDVKRVIEMTQPATLVVRVVDTDGKPIEGARVLSPNHGGRDANDPAALTNAEGVRVIDDLKPGNDLAEHERLVAGLERYSTEYMKVLNSREAIAQHRRITARHPDYSTQSERIERVPGEMTLVMRRGVRLGGRVVDAEGQPVERSYVEVQDRRLIPPLENETDAFGMSRGINQGVFTDQEGVFDFEALPEGDYLLRMRPNSTLDVDVPEQTPPPGQLVQLRREAGDQQINLAYEDGRIVQLRLVDRDTGEPIVPDRELVAQTVFYPRNRNDDFMGHGFQRVPVEGSMIAVRVPDEPGWLDLVVFEDQSGSTEPRDFYRELKPKHGGVRVPASDDSSDQPIDYPIGRRAEDDRKLIAEAARLRERGDVEQAVELQKKLVAKYPDDSDLSWGLARSLNRLDRDAEAAAVYERLIALETRYEASQINELAWIYVASEFDDVRDPDRARQLAERALELDRTPSVSLLDTYAAALAATGDPRKAVEIQRQVVEKCSPGSLEKYQGRLEKYEAMLTEE